MGESESRGRSAPATGATARATRSDESHTGGVRRRRRRRSSRNERAQRRKQRQAKKLRKRHSEGGVRSRPLEHLTHPLDRSFVGVFLLTIFFTALALLSGIPVVLVLTIALPLAFLVTRLTACDCLYIPTTDAATSWWPCANTSHGWRCCTGGTADQVTSYWPPAAYTTATSNKYPVSSSAPTKSGPQDEPVAVSVHGTEQDRSLLERLLGRGPSSASPATRHQRRSRRHSPSPPPIPFFSERMTPTDAYWLGSPAAVSHALLIVDAGLGLEQLRDMVLSRVLLRPEMARLRYVAARCGCSRTPYWKCLLLPTSHSHHQQQQQRSNAFHSSNSNPNVDLAQQSQHSNSTTPVSAPHQTANIANPKPHQSPGPSQSRQTSSRQPSKTSKISSVADPPSQTSLSSGTFPAPIPLPPPAPAKGEKQPKSPKVGLKAKKEPKSSRLAMFNSTTSSSTSNGTSTSGGGGTHLSKKDRNFFHITDHVFSDHPIGSKRALRERLAILMRMPLSKKKPLWELRHCPAPYMSSGTGKVVLIIRVHQCLTDGVSLLSLLVQYLSDSGGGGGPLAAHSASHHRPDSASGHSLPPPPPVIQTTNQTGMSTTNVSRDSNSIPPPPVRTPVPSRAFAYGPDAGTAGAAAASHGLSPGSVMPGQWFMKPRFGGVNLPLNVLRAVIVGPLSFALWLVWSFSRRCHNTLRPLAADRVFSHRKSVYWTSFELPRIWRLKQVSRGALNDVMMTAITGAMRMYLREVPLVENPPDLNATIVVDVRPPITPAMLGFNPSDSHATGPGPPTPSGTALCVSSAPPPQTGIRSGISTRSSATEAMASRREREREHGPITVINPLGVEYVLVTSPLPTSTEGSIPRLWEIRHLMEELKSSADPTVMWGAHYFINRLLPNFLGHWLLNLIHRNSSLLVSNLQGPSEQLTIGSYRVSKVLYWMAPPGGSSHIPVGLNVISYAGRLHVTLSCNALLMSNAKKLAKAFRAQVLMLSQLLSRRRVPGEGRPKKRKPSHVSPMIMGTGPSGRAASYLAADQSSSGLTQSTLTIHMYGDEQPPLSAGPGSVPRSPLPLHHHLTHGNVAGGVGYTTPLMSSQMHISDTKSSPTMSHLNLSTNDLSLRLHQVQSELYQLTDLVDEATHAGAPLDPDITYRLEELKEEFTDLMMTMRRRKSLAESAFHNVVINVEENYEDDDDLDIELEGGLRRPTRRFSAISAVAGRRTSIMSLSPFSGGGERMIGGGGTSPMPGQSGEGAAVAGYSVETSSSAAATTVPSTSGGRSAGRSSLMAGIGSALMGHVTHGHHSGGGGGGSHSIAAGSGPAASGQHHGSFRVPSPLLMGRRVPYTTTSPEPPSSPLDRGMFSGHGPSEGRGENVGSGGHDTTNETQV